MSNNIQLYGDREDVKELQARIQRMLPSLMPGSTKLTESEALGLAQVAYLHGLSPFNQEIYFLKTDDRSLGVMPGIRGYRKAARRQMPDGETYWLEFVPIAPADAQVDKPEDVHCAFMCILRDSVTMRRYVEMVSMVSGVWEPKTVDEDGGLFEELKSYLRELVGPQPLTYGYGVVYKYELGRMNKARINPLSQAKIRAERHALRLRFDLDTVGSGGWDAESAAAVMDEREEAIDLDAIDLEKAEQETHRTANENIQQLGYEVA